jgi:transcriptional regulator with XRE-family HTH domain
MRIKPFKGGDRTGAIEMNAGTSIRRWRQNARLNQGELAQKSGLTQACICQIEKGTREPHIKSLTAIAEALGVPISNLMNFQEADKKDIAIANLERRLRRGDVSIKTIKALTILVESLEDE